MFVMDSIGMYFFIFTLERLAIYEAHLQNDPFPRMKNTLEIRRAEAIL